MPFDRRLLTRPLKLGDDSEDLWYVYRYIKDTLEKKMKNYPAKQKKFAAIEREFLLLYEKTKEKEREQTKDGTKSAFSYFRKLNGNYNWIFREIKWKARRFIRSQRHDT